MVHFHRAILAVENVLLALLLSAMILLAAAQILMRNLFLSGFSWGDPTLRILVLWVALLGAMVATREQNHIRIDLLSRYLPAKVKQPMDRVTDLFASSVCGLLAWHSARFVYFEWQDGNLLFSAVPAWLCELILPIAFSVMALRLLISAIAGRPEIEPK